MGQDLQRSPMDSPKANCQTCREPLTAIVFETEDCSRFVVHEELFGPDSSFDNSQLILHQSKEHDQLKVEVELDTERFGFYVDILYRSFFVPDFKLRHAQFGGSQPLTRILDFWTTASQLPSARMTEIAKEAFTHQVQSLSAEQWQEWFQTKPLTFLEEWMLDLQDAHDLVGDLPDDHLLQDDLVQACANMPPLVFAISFTALRGRFARQVIKQFALNQAAPGTKRKGPDVEWAPAEGETANKKQRVVEMAEDECHWNNQT